MAAREQVLDGGAGVTGDRAEIAETFVVEALARIARVVEAAEEPARRPDDDIAQVGLMLRPGRVRPQSSQTADADHGEDDPQPLDPRGEHRRGRRHGADHGGDGSQPGLLQPREPLALHIVKPRNDLALEDLGEALLVGLALDEGRPRRHRPPPERTRIDCPNDGRFARRYHAFRLGSDPPRGGRPAFCRGRRGWAGRASRGCYGQVT